MIWRWERSLIGCGTIKGNENEGELNHMVIHKYPHRSLAMLPSDCRWAGHWLSFLHHGQ